MDGFETTRPKNQQVGPSAITPLGSSSLHFRRPKPAQCVELRTLVNGIVLFRMTLFSDNPAGQTEQNLPERGKHLRVVITGGAGFLGSHLCDLFLGKGWDVLCLDNLC